MKRIMMFSVLFLLFSANSLLIAQNTGEAAPRSFASEEQFQEYLDYIRKNYSTPSGISRGDVNASGTIDIVDALLVAQFFVGIRQLDCVACGDVNGDGFVTIVDALMISQYYVGLNPAGFGGGTSETPSVHSDYSETNVQEAGVDEADIVKTDGSCIYSVSGKKLIISRAYPPEQTAIINTITYSAEFAPQELYLTGNKLVVIGQSPYRRVVPEIYGVNNNVYNYQMTRAIIYDITDRELLIEIRSIEIDGKYFGSRRIGSMLYLLSSRKMFAYGTYPVPELEAPVYRDSQAAADFLVLPFSRIEYFPFLMKADFLNIAALDLADITAPLQVKSYITPSQQIYVSPLHLYIACYNSIGAMANQPAWFSSMPSITACYIIKFRLDGTGVTCTGTGSVPGNVLNRFSMSEYNGYFRIATTAGVVSQGSSTAKNNVYVLDETMQITGKLEGLAPGEKIYSARFMGNKGYLVTFQKVDPLFVLDLTDPHNPVVLGELKIPGYSDYLHPYDETHIIGIGKDTQAADTGNFSWFQGIKAAIFDVSDVQNPVELHKVVIGHRGTTSEALYDPRAFLFARQKNLFVIPVTLAEFETEPASPSQAAPVIYQGAYVYDLTLEAGFRLKGRITHNEIDPNSASTGKDYLLQGRTVRRSLYIEEALYTLSNSGLMVNSLGNLELIKRIIY